MTIFIKILFLQLMVSEYMVTSYPTPPPAIQTTNQKHPFSHMTNPLKGNIRLGPALRSLEDDELVVMAT